jgi:uncharacterized membrane protein (UPF0182 family)
MTDDSLQDTTGLATLPTDEINYMRNAVKATVDAYDGTVTLYEWDEQDPILKAWMGAFPDTVKDRSEISDELEQHLRYPEDLFKVQRYQYARYHITDENDWYQGNDRWAVPKDPNSTSNLQPPYRLFVDETPADDASTVSDETWSLTSTFVPFGKNNLASFVSVNSDAESSDYGKITVRELTDQNTQGPALIANEFNNDDDVRARLLPFSSGQSPPLFGNLLTLPVRDGLIYVEPVYAVRNADSGYPILRFVLVSYGEQVGIGETMTEALADALGVDNIATPDPEPGGEPDPEPNPDLTVNQQIRALLAQAQTAFDAAQAALDDGNLGTYKDENDKAARLVQQAIDLAEGRDAGATADDEAQEQPAE